MSNWDNLQQSSTFIHIANMTVNPQTHLSQPLETDSVQPVSPPMPPSGSIYNPYAQSIQVPIMQLDPFEDMRKKNQDYQTAKQYQKNLLEVQEQQNLEAAYQAMLSREPQPIKSNVQAGDDRFPLLSASSLGEAARWSMTSTGLTMPQALCAILTCVCAATWGRVSIACNMAGDWIQPLILWSLILADSGLGKSTMFGRLLAPFNAVQDRRNAKANGSMSDDVNSILSMAIKKAKKKIIRDIDLSDPHCLEKLTEEMVSLRQTAGYKVSGNAIEPATITVSTATGAGLRKLLLKNGGTCFFASPEPEALSYVLDRGGEELLKKGYNQETEYYSSAHKEIVINKPSISFLCASQIEIFIEMMASKKYRHLQGGGFLARILPALANAHVNNSRMRESCYLGDGKTRYETRIEELLAQCYTQDGLDHTPIKCTIEKFRFLA